jgi:uncharacterized protein
MNFIRFDESAEFKARTWPFLLEHEAENNLMVGLTDGLARGPAVAAPNPAMRPIFCAVEGGGTVITAGLMTPPHRITLTRGPQEALSLIARELHARGICPPGVIAPSHSSQCFATAWSRITKQPAHRKKALRIYQLDRVTPSVRTVGRLETATRAEFDLALKWMLGFYHDVDLTAHDTEASLRQRIDSGNLFFWLDLEPKSMASTAGPTPNGIRIGAVYTPPELRGRGYASAAVAALSQKMLDGGRRFCFLFTDMANPTSNSIYQKIGYQPVCDFEERDFGK